MLVTGTIFVLLAALAHADNAVVFCEKHADCQPGLYMPFPVSILRVCHLVHYHAPYSLCASHSAVTVRVAYIQVLRGRSVLWRAVCKVHSLPGVRVQ
jgi:hypothetical protein